MNDEQYEKGLEVRRAVMGDSYVDKALNSAILPSLCKI